MKALVLVSLWIVLVAGLIGGIASTASAVALGKKPHPWRVGPNFSEQTIAPPGPAATFLITNDGDVDPATNHAVEVVYTDTDGIAHDVTLNPGNSMKVTRKAGTSVKVKSIPVDPPVLNQNQYQRAFGTFIRQ